MKIKVTPLASLEMEIPALEATIEGKLKGGFSALNAGLPELYGGANGNCDCDCTTNDCPANSNCNCHCTTNRCPPPTSAPVITNFMADSGKNPFIGMDSSLMV